MPSVKIPLKGLAPLIEKLGKGAPAAIRRGLISSGLAMVAEMQKRTADAEIFDRGTFRRSWKSAPTERGVRVFNDAPYAGVIEGGRRPGARQPPSNVMEQWAKRKLGLNDLDAKAAAFALARSIGKKGIKGKPILEQAIPALTKIAGDEVRSFLAQAIRDTGH